MVINKKVLKIWLWTGKRKNSPLNFVKNKGKKVKRKTKKQKLIEKLIVGSEWRVSTGDTEITSTGKEVLSGWQQWTIVERLHAKDHRWEGYVRVKYTDDADDEEPFEYPLLHHYHQQHYNKLDSCHRPAP